MAQEKIGALVIGGDFRGLGIVRSLGRRGIPVWVLRNENSIASHSRYTQRCLPWPNSSASAQIQYLRDLGQRHRLHGWVLFPTGDGTAALLAQNEDALRDNYRLTTPKWDVMQWAYDKKLTYRLAEQANVDCPWTVYPRDRQDVASLQCRFPVILKPSVRSGHNRFLYAKAWRTDNRSQLLARYDEASSMVDPDLILIQELIPGGGDAQFSFAAMCQDGHVLTSLVARRTRQWPVDFGRNSTFVELVQQPEVEQLGRRILNAMGYTGVVEVEFKYDHRSQQFKLLDINARVWGWHTLCQRAGVDFPFLLWQMTRGRPFASPTARTDGRWLRMMPDLSSAIVEMRTGRLSVSNYLRSFHPPLEFAAWAKDDPLPAILDLPLLGFKQLRKVMHR